MTNKSLLLICITIIVSALILSRAGFIIKNTTGIVDSSGKVSDTISVSGDGKVTARPDMVKITISVKSMASNSHDALEKVNQKINQIIKILKENGLSETDYQTTGLNIYTEYNYSGDTRRIIGQRASQSLNIKVNNIDNKAVKAAKIIDDLSVVSDIEMSDISFDIEDKTKLFTQAREMAFKKAKQKAEELANLSNVKLGKPTSIVDTTYDVSPRSYNSNVAEMKSMITASGGADTQISSGEMSISANLQILWSIE